MRKDSHVFGKGLARCGLALLSVLGSVSAAGCIAKMKAESPALKGYSERSYAVEKPIPFRYSIFTDDANADASTVLYYFHGTGGDEHTWLASGEAIVRRWRQSSKPMPTVVGVTFGRFETVFPESGGARRGYLEYFMREAMPAIEARLGAPIKSRYVFGVSVGAQSAAQIVFRYPDKIAKAVLASPAVYLMSPYEGSDRLEALIRSVEAQASEASKVKRLVFNRSGVAFGIKRAFNMQKFYMPDEASWEKGAITLNIAEAPKDAAPKVLISCGDRDELGLNPGARELARLAAARSYDVELEILEGGHTSIDMPRIADFFLSP